MAEYGEFSQSGDEFIIGRPDTPKFWRNYLTNKSLLSEVTQLGTGKTKIKNKDGDIFPLLSNKNHGRLIYIRDQESGEFWTLNWIPTKHQTEYFETRHGLGYSVISSSAGNIDCSLTIFQPEVGATEIWQVKVANRAAKRRRISVFVLADWADMNSSNYYKNMILATKSHDKEKSGLVGFMTGDFDIMDYDCLLSGWMGEYDSLDSPIPLNNGKCGKTKGQGVPAIGVIQKNLVLGEKGSSEFNIFVGGVFVDSNKPLELQKEKIYTAANIVVKNFLGQGSASTELTKIKKNIRAELDFNKVATPEIEFNRYFNYFLSFQASQRKNWVAKTEETTIRNFSAARGVLLGDSDSAERMLFSVLAHQLKDGRVANSWSGTTEEISSTNNIEHSIVLAEMVVNHLKETGESELLRCSIPYLDGGEGTILEHLTKSVEYVLENRADGLIKIDDLESTAISARLTSLLRELIPVLEANKDEHLTKRYQQVIEHLATTVEKMWQSPWYSRGRKNDNRIGVNTEPHGFELSAQIWPIIAKISSSDRSKQIIQKLAKTTTAYPPLNLSPAYKNFNENNIKYSQWLAGKGRNSTVEINEILNLITASTLIGDGDLAWRFFKQILPNYLSANPNRYFAEPFTLPSTIDGPDSLKFGQGQAIYDNEAGLAQATFLEKIIGAQPTLNGLKLDPCLPKSWRSCEASRRFRGADYHIRIQNPFHVSKGVDRIIVDGIRLTGNLIRPFNGGSHFVEVILG